MLGERALKRPLCLCISHMAFELLNFLTVLLLRTQIGIEVLDMKCVVLSCENINLALFIFFQVQYFIHEYENIDLTYTFV